VSTITITITIANAHDSPPSSEWPEWYVYVGRAVNRKGLGRSSLANPYPIGQRLAFADENERPVTRRLTRDDAIGLYQSYITGYPWKDDIPREVRRELRRLRALLAKHGKLVLVCWCAPKSCHAEVIREALLRSKGGQT